MAFARSHNKLEPKTEAFWQDMVGRMILKVSEDHIESRLPPWDTVIDGTTRHMDGFSASSPYHIVHYNRDALVVVANDPVTGTMEPTTYNFVSPDVFWVYTGRGPDESPGSHLREYFRRIRD